MATRTAMAGGDEQPFKKPRFLENILGRWNEFTRFLSDVRAEMRKVVSPSPKEVQVTTTVVLFAVFIFGVFFFIVDWIFRIGVNSLLQKLGGLQ
jgi:preprotein translocase subunit SecE